MLNNANDKNSLYALNIRQRKVYEEAVSKPDTVKFNNILLVKFDSWIDLIRLKEAVITAVNNHQFINSRIIVDENGQPYYRKTDSDNNFSIRDIEEIKFESKDIDEIKNTLARPFNIIENRLFRVKIINAKGLYIFLEMHQLISDDSSLQIFLEDVSQAYLAYEMKKEEMCGYEVLIQEKNQLNSDEYTSSQKYFSEVIDGYDADFKLIGDVNNSEEIISKTMELVSRRAIADMVKSFCKSSNLTVEGFFTAAFGYLLSEYNAGKNSLFSTIYSGRNDSKLKNTVSMLSRKLPVACDVTTENALMSVVDYIKGIDSQLSDSKNNSIYPFEELVVEKGLTSNVVLNYQGEDFNFYSFCGKISKPIEIHSVEVKSPILFRVSIHGAEITYNVDYDAGLYSSEFIDCFLDAYDVVISEFMMRQKLSEVETTSYKVVKLLNSLKSGENADCEVLDRHGKLIPPGAFGYLNSSKTITRLLF